MLISCAENNGVAIFVYLNNIIPARNSSSGTDVFTGVWGRGYGITPELQKRSVRILLECFLVFVIISLRTGDYLLALTEWAKCGPKSPMVSAIHKAARSPAAVQNLLWRPCCKVAPHRHFSVLQGTAGN